MECFFFCIPFPLLGMRWVVLCDLVCVEALKSERLSKVVAKSCGGPNSEITTFEMFSLGGVFDNVQISTTLRCAYLLANPGKHVPLGGVFDKARIFIHIQIWLSFCKSSSAHEVKIASTSVHGCGGGASGGAGGVDGDGASGGTGC